MRDEIASALIFAESEIVPIPARCTRGHAWIGRDAIRAPSLRNCCCFWCGAPLRPHSDYPPVVDALTRRLRGSHQFSFMEEPR